MTASSEEASISLVAHDQLSHVWASRGHHVIAAGGDGIAAVHPASAAVGGGAVGLGGASVGATAAHEHVDEAQLQIPVWYCSARQVILLMQPDSLVMGCASGREWTFCVCDIHKGLELKGLATV